MDEAVLGPGRCFLSRTGSSILYRFLCLSQSASKMYDFVAAGAPFFTFRTSYVGAVDAAKSAENGSAGFCWINLKYNYIRLLKTDGS